MDEKIICEYNDFSIIEKDGKLYYIDDNDEVHEVVEVLRIPSSAYDNGNVTDDELLTGRSKIDFDICGELDDCSAFVYWRYAAA